MDDLKSIIAKNITELRKENKLTQLELAEKLNYSDKSVSKWERGESIPDVIVLKELSDLFGVSVDYMLKPHKEIGLAAKLSISLKKKNRTTITAMCVLLVWLVATITFVVLEIAFTKDSYNWLAFIYAIPTSFIVWLIMNCVWFNLRNNFLIISFLMWSALAATFITLICLSINIWELFLLGVPAQIIIWLWSRIKLKHKS